MPKGLSEQLLRRRYGRLAARLGNSGLVLQGTITRRTIEREDPDAPGMQKNLRPLLPVDKKAARQDRHRQPHRLPGQGLSKGYRQSPQNRRDPAKNESPIAVDLRSDHPRRAKEDIQ
jgi:hypothetical protein